MIIEGIITTESETGAMHVAPIGPHVSPDLKAWTLRPFQTSRTFSHLRRTGRGVFHVTDDAFLMASSVLGLGNEQVDDTQLVLQKDWEAQIASARDAKFESSIGWVLERSHRCFAIQIDSWDVSGPRAIAHCSVTLERTLRPFWGWNRAKHSILELAILMSRKDRLGRTYLDSEWERHREIIEKTAGPEEVEALALLSQALSQ